MNVFIIFELNKLIIVELNLKTKIPNDHPIILVTKLIKVEFYQKHFYWIFLPKLVINFLLLKNIFIEIGFTI